eukprot:sb/3471708/
MLAAALFLIGTLGLLVNGFIVYKMIKNRKNFNEHTILFVNVAATDLVFALAAVVIRAPGILLQESYYSEPWFCIISFYVIQFSYGAGSWSLVLITLDRFIAILFPLRYSSYLNRRTRVAFLLLAWLVIPALYAAIVSINPESPSDTIVYDGSLYRCSINVPYLFPNNVNYSHPEIEHPV